MDAKFIHEMEQMNAAVRMVAQQAFTAYRTVLDEGGTPEQAGIVTSVVVNAIMGLLQVKRTEGS